MSKITSQKRPLNFCKVGCDGKPPFTALSLTEPRVDLDPKDLATMSNMTMANRVKYIQVPTLLLCYQNTTLQITD
eukprot:4134814-Amphidinium_carterae.1